MNFTDKRTFDNDIDIQNNKVEMVALLALIAVVICLSLIIKYF